MRKIFCVVSNPEKFGRGHLSRQLEIQSHLKLHDIDYAIEFNSENLKSPSRINESLLILDISERDKIPALHFMKQFSLIVGFDWSGDFVPDYNIVVLMHPNKKYFAKRKLTAGLQNFIVHSSVNELREKPSPVKNEYFLISLGYSASMNSYLQALSDLEFLNKTQVVIATGKKIELPHIENLRILVDPPEFIELLAEATAIISNGGTTYIESLFLGKPVLPLPQNEEEKYFVKELESLTIKDPVNENFRKLDFEKAAKIPFDTYATERIGQLLIDIL